MEAIDKELVRKSLKELVISEPDFVRSLLDEVTSELNKTKRQRLEQIVSEDFDEFGDVFRALA